MHLLKLLVTSRGRRAKGSFTELGFNRTTAIGSALRHAASVDPLETVRHESPKTQSQCDSLF
jgi:hypothetical protein